MLVASGSVPLRHNLPQLVVAGAVAGLVVPMLLLVRQWLGWTTLQRRLMATAVEYEESGWYDGQVWEKPVEWRQQDLLVANHEVKPVLWRLQQAMAITAALMLVGASLCQAL
jgi:polyferredoxin